MNPCQNCAAATPHYLCLGCEVTLAGLVATIPHLIGDLNVTLAKEAKQAPRGGGGATQENPMPIHVGALNAKEALNAAMAAARRIHPEPGTQEGIHAIALHPDAGHTYRMITDAHTQATRTIDRQPERKRVGTCEAPAFTSAGALTICNQPLYAIDGAEAVLCESCGAEWDTHAVFRVQSEKVLDRVSTPMEITAYFDKAFGIRLTDNMIRKWKTRGHLVPVEDTPTRRKYRIGDVMYAWEAWYGKRLPGTTRHDSLNGVDAHAPVR